MQCPSGMNVERHILPNDDFWLPEEFMHGMGPTIIIICESIFWAQIPTLNSLKTAF